MFFLIFYYCCFWVVGIFYVIQKMHKIKKAIYFLNDFGEDEDEDEDEYKDDTDDKDDEDDLKNNHEKMPIQKYEDKYKINKEIMDDELTQEKLEGLCNCFILENTPNGNALILYNYKTSSFIYYSDNSIPYKYLNTIARKYVNTYRCKQLYVNPEDELEKNKKDSDTKDQETKESDAKEPDAKQDQETKESDAKEPDAKKDQKKQIFAKFKTYNKNTTNKTQSQQQQQQQPHQSSQQQQQTQQQTQQPKQSQEVIANRYTHQGKIANFNFLKKPDKKLINKKLSLTFSDYKKLNISI